jgi:hypothetical protein
LLRIAEATARNQRSELSAGPLDSLTLSASQMHRTTTMNPKTYPTPWDAPQPRLPTLPEAAPQERPPSHLSQTQQVAENPPPQRRLEQERPPRHRDSPPEDLSQGRSRLYEPISARLPSGWLLHHPQRIRDGELLPVRQVSLFTHREPVCPPQHVPLRRLCSRNLLHMQ